MLAMVVFGAGALGAQEAPGAAGVRVDSLAVEGNVRLDASVVRALSTLSVPATLTERDVQAAIRRLMGSGHFEHVEVSAHGDFAESVTLVFHVVERPLVAAVEFRGLERISARTVRDTVGWKPNLPLDPNRVARTHETIRDMLARAGVQLRSIDTTWTALPGQDGVYRLIFDVREGERLNIAEIEFRGNEVMSASALRGVMNTRPEGFLWFRQGRFDRDVLREDLAKRLPEFYGARGYIDFAVVSDTLIVDPQSGKARLVVEVSEGPRYRLGSFTIEGNSRFPSEQLQRIYTTQRQTLVGLPFGRTSERERGEVFDHTALRAASDRVEQLYRNEGYLYAQVEPVVRRSPANSPGDDPTVDVVWAVSERSPFYVNRVSITGNTNTHEGVIRDRIVVFPGDVYDEARLIQSYQAISALGFFETPLPTPDIIPNPETGEVDIVFHVQEKQTGSINFGTSFGGYGTGVSGFLGYSQPNLFGQGKRADVRAEYGWGRSSFQASYTDPSIRGSRNSGSASLFHTDDRYRGFSFNDGRYVRTGGSLQFGIPVPGMRWTRAFLGYSLSHYSYDTFDPEGCAEEDIWCQPSAVASNVSLSLARDTKNHPLFPTAGTRQSLTLSQTGGIFGGSGDFQKVMGEAQWWVPVGQIGGGVGSRPIRTAIGLQTRIGSIFGDASRFPLERFFLGGTMRGEQLRGYTEAEITPFGFIDSAQRGVGTGTRLGDAFVTVSAEYAVRFTDMLSLSLFADAGNIWSDPRQIDLSRLYRGAGVGVTVVTPFGPLGLDYAYGFDRDNPGWKLHFKLSQGF